MKMAWAALAIAGLLIAVGVSFAASRLASPNIGLSSEPITAGSKLAPARTSADKPAARPKKRPKKKKPTPTVTTPAVPPATPPVAPPPVSDDHGGDDDSSGHGSGGSDDSGGHGSDD